MCTVLSGLSLLCLVLFCSPDSGRPELEALWVTVVNSSENGTNLQPLALNLENDDSSKSVRGSTIPSARFVEFW